MHARPDEGLTAPLRVLVAPLALGCVHRSVRTLHCGLRREWGGELEADKAGTGCRPLLTDPLDVLDQRLRDQIGTGATRVGEQHREFIAAEPTEHVGRT